MYGGRTTEQGSLMNKRAQNLMHVVAAAELFQ